SEAARAKWRAPAAIRVNPDVEANTHRHIATGRHHHKFGLDWPDAHRLYRKHRDLKWIEWKGISAHIGSQIVDLKAVRLEAERMARCVRELRRDGIHLTYIDVGGGLGIRYTTEKQPTISNYGRVIARELAPLGCRVLLEPGRSIVGPTGVLLMRVIYTKWTRGKFFVIVDAAMNDFIRPPLYGAVHPITVVRRANNRARIIRADIVGPVCESGDCFLHDWPIEQVRAGDVLALWGAGAYGQVEASNYNSRPRPEEVLVQGRRARVIRKRESRDDLIRGE
ncbi:MAG TPA: diaminopimelate decarboxylase, partial [Candidatus Acidoferrales bacterium]|nr:diaminopimelate decarboxylase [Candidatus Acidoferrales bacterium]